MQASKWASVTRRSNQCLGDRCKNCVEFSNSAFPLLEWSTLINMKKSSPEFAEALKAAKEVYEGRGKKDFFVEKVDNNVVFGYKVTDPATFLSEQNFQSKFGVSVKEAGLMVENLTMPNFEVFCGHPAHRPE